MILSKFKYAIMGVAALLGTSVMTACSDDDNSVDPDQGATTENTYHFDLWVALGKHGGMGRDVQTLVRSMNSLDADQPQITFQGTGTEVNQKLSLETILKGAYYYQVPVSSDRFGKYIIKDNQIQVVAERQFQTNTYTSRKYTHAWLDDNTLLIMAAAGDSKSVVWTKLNAQTMSIIDEGTLSLTLPEGAKVFTTSGIAVYRKSDNKIFYFYYTKTSTRGDRLTPMMTAVINPATLAVEEDNACFLDCEMVGTAYGELLQTTTLIDGSNNLYIACVTEDEAGNEKSHLLKIPAGQTTFDTTYDGYTADGKLISMLYIGGGKALCYARNDQLGTGIDDFSHYYTVINLNTKVAEPVKYNGAQLGYSSGRFSSRMAFINGKAYIGVDAENKNPQIYIYDAKTGQTTLGATMQQGYYFEQIRVVENL